MKKLVKVDRNGTKYFEESCTCWKCGGSGIYEWGAIINGCCSYAGECYACGGTGVIITKTKEYTSEHAAKLEAAREKRQAKREAEAAQKEAERQAAIDEYKRAQAQREAEWAAEKAKSAYVGVVGDKLDVSVTLAFETSFEMPAYNGWGTVEMLVYGFKDDAGNILIWKTGGFLSVEHKVFKKNGTDYFLESEFAHKGDKIRIKASIKDHSEYKGTKQTVLTRVKLVEFIEKADEVTA